jgi:N-acetylglucosaminyldiphosphoundecaprenol N-acetyl-beta-D-mannosaminyltransferase
MRIPVANVAFDNVTMAEAVSAIERMARQNDIPRYVCTGNLDHLVILNQDSDFVSIYRSADLVLADGVAIVWLSKLAPNGAGKPLCERVAGSDLLWELAAASEKSGVKLFFLGGAPGAAEQARTTVLRRHPAANICGIYCPPFETFATEEEQRRIRDTVHAAKPDILLVGLGAPKQEKWIVANKDALGVPVAIGVGGSFEMASGTVRRAPMWMQRNGLEWLFRLMQEPTRLWRRYFVKDMPFLFFLAWRSLRRRRADASSDA